MTVVRPPVSGTQLPRPSAAEVGPPVAPPAAATVAPATRVVKPWGHELVFAAGEHGYVGKVIVVLAGQALSLQLHEHKDETIALLSGEALVEHGPSLDRLASLTLHSGDTIHLPPGVLHRITAVSDVTFVEASTAADGWRDDVVRLDDRYGRIGTSAP